MFKIGAIVLAAGISRRMGQPKLLLPLEVKPLFRYALEQTIRTKLDPVVLVQKDRCKQVLPLFIYPLLLPYIMFDIINKSFYYRVS